MLHTLKLHGSLAERYGAEHGFHVRDVREAVRALCVQCRDAKADIRDGYFHVLVDGVSIPEERIGVLLPERRAATIDIIPVMRGSGGQGGGIAKIAVGALMVIAGAVLMFFPGTQAFGVPLIMTGLSLTTTGVMATFFPASQPDLSNLQPADQRQSFLFNGAVNSSTQGSALPLAYGKTLVGSVVISAGIETAAAI